MTSAIDKKKRSRKTILLSALSSAVMLLLIYIVYHFNIPNPNMILITALVLFTALGGLIPGAFSGVLMAAYSLYFFSTDNDFLHFSEINARKIGIIFIGIILNYLFVGLLQLHKEKTRRRLAEANESLRASNAILKERVDVTELMKTRQESEAAKRAYEEEKTSRITYSHIAMALSSDYTYLYYVNLDTERFVEYNLDSTNGKMTERREGNDFFAASREDALHQLYAEDQEGFIRAFQKDKILGALDAAGRFSLVYRLMINGAPNYMSMRISRLRDDQSHIIVGVRNVDAQARRDKEADKIRAEEQTWKRISALSADYIVFYTVDPETNQYHEFSGSAAYDAIGFDKEGLDFFERVKSDAKISVYGEDLDRFLTLFTKENVLEEIRKTGLFSMEYRMVMGGQPVYVRLKTAIVQENDRPQLIVGIIDIDAQVRRSAEYHQRLNDAMQQATRDSLTGVRNRNGYARLEAEIDAHLQAGERPEFSVIVFDLNNLKDVNDSGGHQAGDEYIRQACRMICDTFKHSPVFRIGGDEFAVIARGYDYEHTDAILRQIEQINERHALDGQAVVAFGAAKYEGESTVREVFEKADSTMYLHKRSMKSEGENA